MPFQDEILICFECGKTFVFTRRAQKFYTRNGFKHQPKRCKACRMHRNWTVEKHQFLPALGGIERSLPTLDREP